LSIIKDNDPDIFCLIECQNNQISYWAEELGSEYNYIYTANEPTKSEEVYLNKNTYSHDQNAGILVMYRRNKVRVIQNHSIDYEYRFRVMAEREGCGKPN
jgi:hypothetical protein